MNSVCRGRENQNVERSTVSINNTNTKEFYYLLFLLCFFFLFSFIFYSHPVSVIRCPSFSLCRKKKWKEKKKKLFFSPFSHFIFGIQSFFLLIVFYFFAFYFFWRLSNGRSVWSYAVSLKFFSLPSFISFTVHYCSIPMQMLLIRSGSGSGSSMGIPFHLNRNAQHQQIATHKIREHKIKSTEYYRASAVRVCV